MERAHLKRRLKAVLLADVVGYSRLMSVDEEGTHARVADRCKDLIEPSIAEHGGRLIRTMGDGLLVEFESAADAVYCGLDMQQKIAERDVAVDPKRRIRFRIGINTGDVIVDDHDIYGNSVNIAARLEGLAEPGEIYVTRGVRDQLEGNPALSFEDKGERRVKNIDHPVRVYRVRRVEEAGRGALPKGIMARGGRLFRTQFAHNWRSAALGMLGLAVVAAVTVGALPLYPDYSITSRRASIMVMPFRNASGNPAEDYFADAVTDDLTTDLSRLSDTSVISPGTAFTYKGKAADPKEIGREFGVRYMLEGNIRKVGTRVQTNAQLVDTRTAAHIWADRFDYEVAELSDLQHSITGGIASSLRIQLVKAENRRAIAERPADPDAIDLRLRAMALLVTSTTPDHYLSARQYLEEALRRDPQSADSWSQLGFVLINEYLNHWNEAKDSPEAGKRMWQRAAQAVQESLKIDPSIAMTHYVDGLVRRAKGEQEGALDAFDRAIQLDPNFARAYAQKGNQLVMVGRPKEAPPLVLKAIGLSPRDPVLGAFYWILGRAYFVMKDYSDAIVWLRKSVELMPDLWYNRAYLLSAYALTDRHQQPDAQTTLSDHKDLFGGYTIQRIKDIYEKERNRPDPGIQASFQELYKGLQKAGVQ